MDVSTLEGPALRLAVARACGYRLEQEAGEWVVWLPDGTPRSLSQYGWRPDEVWADGGPIIERERIGFEHHSHRMSHETRYTVDAFLPGRKHETGPTMLIAAMRAYVASKRP